MNQEVCGGRLWRQSLAFLVGGSWQFRGAHLVVACGEASCRFWPYFGIACFLKLGMEDGSNFGGTLGVGKDL